MTLISLTDQTFKDAIKVGVCVLDFYATWCQPCKPVGKILDELSMEFPSITFYKIDVEKCPSAAANFGITNLPTVYVTNNGEYKGGIYGTAAKEKFRNEIASVWSHRNE